MQEQKEEIRARTLERLDLSEELTEEQILSVLEDVILEYGREHYLPLEENAG